MTDKFKGRWKVEPNGDVRLVAYVGAQFEPLGEGQMAILIGFAQNKLEALRITREDALPSSLQFSIEAHRARDLGEALIRWAEEAAASKH
jgi:hypothetical protein